MTRKIRHCPYPFTLFEVTTRTLQGRLLLTPSRDLNEIILGILGRALFMYPAVQLHCFVFLSNHYHLLLSTPDTQQLSRFVGYLNANLAKEAGRLAEWKEKLWSRRFQAIPVLDSSKLFERIRYVLEHGAKENLVASPEDWPGVHCIHALTKGEKLCGIWFDRSAEFEARRKKQPFGKYEFSTSYEVPLSPFPGWEQMPESDRQHKLHEMVDEIKEQTRTRLAREGKQPLGAQEVTLQGPHQRPNETKKSPAPLCHTSIGRIRESFREAYRAFVGKYRDAVERIQLGEREVCFPPPSFPPGVAYVAWPALEFAEYTASRMRDPFPYAIGFGSDR